MLITVLQALQKKKVVVFLNSCHSVKFHHRVLHEFKLPVYYCMVRYIYESAKLAAFFVYNSTFCMNIFEILVSYRRFWTSFDPKFESSGHLYYLSYCMAVRH